MGRLHKLVTAAALLTLLTAPGTWGSAVEGPGPSEAYVTRPPILVQGDLGFHGANGVVAGTGTPADPYVIRGWEVRNAPRPLLPNPAGEAVDAPRCSITLAGTSAHVVVEGNRVTHAAPWNSPRLDPLGARDHGGICLLGAENVTVRGNLVHWVVGDGIKMQDARHVEVVENRVERAWSLGGNHGIRLLGGDDITLRNNTVTKFGWGILGASSGVHVAGNEILFNKDGGVKVTSGPIVVEENTFYATGTAVDVGFAKDVTLRGNLFRLNWPAVDVGRLGHVVARNNTFLDNDPAVRIVDDHEDDGTHPTADVRWNWWGTPAGPEDSSFETTGLNPTVLWDPWLKQEPARHVGGEGVGSSGPCFPTALCHPDAWTGPTR